MANTGLEITLKANSQNFEAALNNAKKVIDSTVVAVDKMETALDSTGASISGFSGVASQSFDKVADSVFAAANAFNAQWEPIVQKAEDDAKKTTVAITTLADRVAKFGGGVRAFSTGVSTAPPALKQVSKNSNEAALALSNLGRIAQDAPFGFIGIANNLNPMLESFQRLKATTGTTGSALKALAGSLVGPAGLGFALSIVSSALVVFGDKLFGSKKQAEEAKSAFDGMLDSAANEALKLRESFALITDANVPLENRKNIIKDLRSEYGVYLKNISDEALLTGQAASAYDLINTAILKKLQLQAAEEKILPLIKEQVDLQFQLNKLQKDGADLRRFIDATTGTGQAASAYDLINNAILKKLQLQAAEEKILPLIKEQVNLQYELNKLQKDGADLRRFIDATTGAKEFKVQADNAIAIRDSNQNLADQLSLQKRIAAVGKEINNLFSSLAPLLPSSERATRGVVVTVNKEKTKEEFVTRLRELSTELAPIPVKIEPFAGVGMDGSITREEANFLSGRSSVLENLNQLIENMDFDKLQEKMRKTADLAINFLAPAFDAAFDAIENGKNVFQAVGEALKQLVIELIKAALQSAIVSLLINSIFPGAGAAFSFGSLFAQIGGLPKFAQGGIVPPGYPNDSYPALLSSNEAVIPLDRLGSMMQTGGSFPAYLPAFELRGDVLRAWYQRAENSYRRRN